MNILYWVPVSFILGLVVTSVGEHYCVKRWDWRVVLRNRHIHHSTFGAVASFVGTVLAFTDYLLWSVFLIFCGMGVIAEHTRSERRFVFIERQTAEEAENRRLRKHWY